MANGDKDGKFWSLSTALITIMGSLIAVLVVAGFSSLGNKIDTGDAMINARLSKIEDYQKTQNDCLMRMSSELTRIDTLQKIRIERENREEGRKRNNN